MIYDNLNKENFWNDLYAKYPKAVQVFCDWIDKYKKENKWDKLFNPNYKFIHSTDEEGTTSTIISEPKFHDLPIALQTGIWIEFLCERGGCSWEIEDMFEFDLATDITGFMISESQDYE